MIARRIGALTVALVLGSTGVAAAAPGDLDTTFSGNGTATFNAGQATVPLNETVTDAAAQSNGSIVYVGERGEGVGATVSRTDVDGTFDTGFGTNGHFTFPTTSLTFVNSVAIQTDGKIVVAGAGFNASSQGDFVVARLNANGTLDTGFGTGGIATIDGGSNNEQLADVAVQSNGGIVATGSVFGGMGSTVAVRLTAGGAPASGFGTGGIAPITGINALTGPGTPALAVTGDDLLIAGLSQTTFGFGVLKLDGATGSPVSGFGASGVAVNTFSGGGGAQSANAIQVGAGGAIVVVGDLFISPAKDVGIARFDADGDPDPTFDTDGSLVVSLGAYDSVEGLVLPAGGGVRIAGYTSADFQGTNADIVVAAYDAAGAPVGGFGAGGVTTTDLGASEGARALVQQGTDLVVAGEQRQSPFSFGGPGGSDAVLARYDGASGALDSGFGSGGIKVIAETLTRDSNDAGDGAALLPDGKLILAGTTDRPSGGADIVVTRVNQDGTVDTSFGSGGFALGGFTSGSNRAQGNAVAIQPDGKIVVAGAGIDTNAPEWVVARFNPNGTLDTGFGTGGRKFIDGGSSFIDGARDVAIQSDGKIVLAGVGNDSATASQTDMTVIRLDAGGSPDTSFSTDGKAYASPAPAMSDSSEATSVAIQDDGKILAGGNVFSSGAGNFGLARFGSDGTLETGFGIGGVGIADFGGNDSTRDIAIDGSGNVVAVGQTQGGTFPNPTFDVAYARFQGTDGQLDTTFGTAGKVTRDLSAAYESLSSVAIQPDGKIVLGGETGPSQTNPTAGNNALVHRALVNGDPDPSFGTGGSVTIEEGEDSVREVLVSPDGRIIAAGDSDNDLLAARLLGDPPSGTTTVTGTSPATGADDNNPEVTGTAPAGTTVRIYTNAACSGVDIGAGPASAFTTTGITVFVPDDTTSTLYARASNASGSTACSAAGPVYQEVTPGPSDQASGGASPGGSVSTNESVDSSDPVGTEVTTPSGGAITITEQATSTPAPSGFSLLGQQVDITAPTETATSPLVLVFDLDASLLPAGVDETNLQVFRNGVAVDDCDAGAGTSATPNPCVAARTSSGGVVTLTVRTSQASSWNFGVATGSSPPPDDTGQGTTNTPPVSDPPPSSTPPKKCKKGAKLKKGKCVKKKKKGKKKR